MYHQLHHIATKFRYPTPLYSYMLRVSFKIQNIFSKDIWYDMYTYTKQLSRNKYFESQVIYSDHNIFEFVLDLSWNGRDHVGPNIELSLFGYHIIVGIYDSRHWDYKEGKWAS